MEEFRPKDDSLDEVQDLLTAWGLGKLIPTFTKHQITIESLSALTNEDVKELIPLIGPRALFKRSWNVWLKNYNEEKEIISQKLQEAENAGSNISQSDPQDINPSIPGKRDTIENLLLLEPRGSSGAQRVKVEPTQEAHTTTSEENNSPIELCTVTISPNNTVPDNEELLQLLKDDFEATCLINYIGDSLPNEYSRNLLAFTIAKHILKVNKNSTITGFDYNKWCGHIKTLFPHERTSVYYLPPCITDGTNHQARGKLVSQVLNTRRKYQKLGLLDKKAGSSKRSSTITESGCSNDAGSDESLFWLEYRSTPWSLVLLKWAATLEVRKACLQEDSIEDYINKFPALQKPEGCTLLLNDFESQYPAQNHSLFSNFPVTKPDLIKLLSNKKPKDTYHSELIQLSKSTDEEHSNLAAILSLTELIKPNIVVISTEDRLSGASAPKKAKSGKRKPSTVESREAFVMHIKDENIFQVTIQKRHETITELGLTPQPYVAIVGPTLSTIKSYYVIINNSIFYSQQNILQSIDTCFKVIWALNTDYPSDAYGPWYFIQKSFYNLYRPFDKGSTSAESLMTDCNLTV